MPNVTIDKMQRDPLTYLQQVEAGETLIIVRADGAIAELRPIAHSQQLCPFGLCKGEFTVPDDFDKPFSEDFFSARMVLYSQIGVLFKGTSINSILLRTKLHY
jgi:antitoxin (DNA-binding transcriptional repressor) of toxin-antitoxin stability system